MTANQIRDEIIDTAKKLQNVCIPYLVGSNSITVTDVNDNLIRATRTEGSVTIPLDAVAELAFGLAQGKPIHIDTLFHGRGNYRTALETITANSPSCGYLPANSRNNRGVKKIVWFPNAIHSVGQTLDVTDLMEQTIQENTVLSRIENNSISRALLSKPFLILTGPSGTGKTRGALQLAESLCDADFRAVVAVGADWTDNRHVLGFLNPLQTFDGDGLGLPIFETTPILNLLLHANNYTDITHVLILDEMNLSHVERYFADFLSAMELKDKEKALKVHSAVMAKTREGLDVPGCIDFPENLFVIGTVNIDETTYMFSPKVLDRANVIEIHAEEKQLENFLKGVAQVTETEAIDYGITFLDAARIIRNEEAHALVPFLPVRDLATVRIMELFRIMKRGRGEFGFRTAREVLAYMRTAYFLTPETERAVWATTERTNRDDDHWMTALDLQILQKILPKLHGSRTRLSPLLGALAQYCATGQEAYAMEHFPEAGNAPKRSLSDARNAQNPQFPKSYQKLERMIEVLLEEQFVSFIC